MEEKPGWKYQFIESLGMKIAINEETKVLYSEDKIRYSPEECQLLSKINYQIPLQVHIVKKIFQGNIISLQ
ncbi:MAG: hypothetical protein K5866_00925 [Treponema sp.]|nr:hypothetical protein [Treponema sp.]